MYSPADRVLSSCWVRIPEVGLSLAICNRFISECGGRIDVESVLQKGSTFRVWFPAATATLPEKSPIM